MKKFTVLLIIFLATFNSLKAQLVSFNFNTSPYIAATNSNTNLVVTNIGLSAGTIGTNITTGTYFTDEPYIEAIGGWTETSDLTAKCFFVEITAQTGYQFSVTNVAYQMYATATGPSATSILLNNTTVGTTNVASAVLQPINQAVAGYNKLTQITLKISGWNNGSRTTTGGGAFRIDNVIVDGLVELIPPNDNTSFINTTAFLVPSEILSVGTDAFIPVMELVMGDSATTDGVSTHIDSLILRPGVSNKFTDWTKIIDQANYVCNNYADTVKGVIGNNIITFHTTGFEIPDGLLNADTCRLLIKLKPNLPDADGKNLQFLLDSAHIYCNPSGSKVGWGRVETGEGKLNVQVIGTKLNVKVEPQVLWKDSLFQLSISAVDSYGNIDIDENGQVQLSLINSEGLLLSAGLLSRNFNQGRSVFSELKFSGSDTMSMKIESDNFEDYNISNLLVRKLVFHDDFESGTLTKWSHANDWAASETNPINETFSLKHNLSGVEGVSYLSSKYNNPQLNHGKMVWRMVLKNGNFDPTSSNRFWYYLMASDSNLLAQTNYGYTVGVNFEGSNDTLSLWKLDEFGMKHLLLKTNFDWNENDTVYIEVIRDANGIWQLAYATNSSISGFTYSNIVEDNSFNNLQFHGLVFQYSSTRAGLLECDDISMGMLNTPPKLMKLEAISIDTLLISFTEPVNQMEAENINNYQLHSPFDKTVILTGLLFDRNYPDKIKLIVNCLKTAKYTIITSNLIDLDGSIMLLDSISCNYEAPAKLADVVITEVMFDPSPAHGLPETDYLEIYNRSDNPFNLNGWRLDIGGLIKTFPDTVIEVGEYITISSSTYSQKFTEFGKFIGLLATTALTNSGKPIRLISNKGNLIDSLFYKQNWISDEEKLDGGWSLERIDPNNLCAESINWNVSTDAKGGSPSNVNSLFKMNLDIVKPKLDSLKLASLSNLEFYFNEELDVKSISQNAFLKISPLVGIIDSVKLSENSKNVTVYLSAEVQTNQLYKLTLLECSDLCGNILNDTVIEMLYHQADVSDIVFNEIMADAMPAVGLPESDYLELYNRSSYPVNIENWELWLGTSKKVFPAINLAPNSYLILCQLGESANFTQYGTVFEMLSSTSLTTSDKALTLKDTSGTLIDSVFYQTSWYHNPDKAYGGWSLERIDPDNLCGTVANWSASVNELGGSPGTINSVYKLNNDNVKPEVTFVKKETDTTLDIEFSEILNKISIKEIGNFKFENESLIIDSTWLSFENSSVVKLFLKNGFQHEGVYKLSIKNLFDLCGNVINDTLLQFEFAIASPNDVVFSELLIDPSPVIGLPEYEYVELFNRSTKKIDLENWKWVVNGSEKLLPRITILPDSFLVIISTTAVYDYGFVDNKIAIPSYPSLSNTSATMQLLDAGGELINEINYDLSWYHDIDKNDGGCSLEIIDPNNQCGGVFNWRASTNILGGTPGQINSVNANNIDSLQPIITQAILINNQSVLLQFSEVINTSSLKPSNFSNNELGMPAIIIIDSLNGTHITLNFDHAFEPHKAYKLSVSGISDYCENELSDTLISFTYNNAQLYNVVINEIMANPEPSKGLPELEYIELFNLTDYAIQAYNWSLKVGSSVITMPYIEMAAHSYLVLFNGDLVNPFTSEISTVGVSNLPSLPLTGSITLFNAQGELICQTPYESAWFTDEFKADGGFSLERIDYNNPNETLQNWQASNNELGGTPGKINSVYRSNPDLTQPELMRAFPLSDTLIGLQFSEAMNTKTININAIQINNEPDLIDAVFTRNNNLSIFYLSLNSNLLSGVTYSIRVSENITDIAGNAIANRDTKLALPIKASPNDLVINELLWNPFDGGVDFIELYNRSAFTINLKQFLVASFDEAGNIKTPKRITTDGALIFPSDYLVLTENQAIVKQHYWIENPFAFMDVESLPSSSNTEGSVAIIDTNGVVIDYMYYTNDMHFGLLGDAKGVSIERVHTNRSSHEQSNWHSAAEKAGWATPGYKNSMAIGEIEGDGIISIERDAFSPDGDGNNDVLYINYKLGEPGFVANITLFDAKGRKVKTLANNELLATEGIFSWDGLTNGNQKAAIGIYIIYIELFNLQGDVKKYKKVCAVNGRFD